MFDYLISSSDAEINATFTDESRYISGGEEDERYCVVFDECDVEAGFSAELDVAAGEEVEGGLLESTLCQECSDQPSCR